MHQFECIDVAMPTGGGVSLHSQVEHYMRDKFAILLLYGIDNLNIVIFFLHIHNH